MAEDNFTTGLRGRNIGADDHLATEAIDNCFKKVILSLLMDFEGQSGVERILLKEIVGTLFLSIWRHQYNHGHMARLGAAIRMGKHS